MDRSAETMWERLHFSFTNRWRTLLAHALSIGANSETKHLFGRVVDTQYMRRAWSARISDIISFGVKH